MSADFLAGVLAGLALGAAIWFVLEAVAWRASRRLRRRRKGGRHAQG